MKSNYSLIKYKIAKSRIILGEGNPGFKRDYLKKNFKRFLQAFHLFNRFKLFSEVRILDNFSIFSQKFISAIDNRMFFFCYRYTNILVANFFIFTYQSKRKLKPMQNASELIHIKEILSHPLSILYHL